jgi:integrase/recombinase XerD
MLAGADSLSPAIHGPLAISGRTGLRRPPSPRGKVTAGRPSPACPAAGAPRRLERRIAKYAATAARSRPALREKKVSPHVLRHSAAMRLLNADVDTTVIALWMGHENVATTQIYIHADLALMERAIARTAPQDTPPGRYQPPDTVLAFLNGL